MNEEFVKDLRRRKLKENTIILYTDSINIVERFLGKPLDKTTTRHDIERYLDSISGQKANSITARLISLKMFFKWLYGIKKGYPEVVDIPLPKGRGNNLISSDLLTEEDILKMIGICDSYRNKAIISLLYDSACRVGEISGIKLEDIVIESGKIGHILVDGKTGRREVPLSFSIPYLKAWLNIHPYKENPKSPLFIAAKTFDMRGLDPATIEGILKSMGRKAGIKKKVFPHLLRHSRLTNLDRKGLSHTAMKAFAGWTRQSNMPSVYSHFSAQDTTDMIYEVDGIVQPKLRKKTILEPIICVKCQTPNDKTNKYCYLCGMALDDDSRKEFEVEELVKLLIKTNPAISKAISEGITRLRS